MKHRVICIGVFLIAVIYGCSEPADHILLSKPSDEEIQSQTEQFKQFLDKKKVVYSEEELRPGVEFWQFTQDGICAHGKIVSCAGDPQGWHMYTVKMCIGTYKLTWESENHFRATCHFTKQKRMWIPDNGDSEETKINQVMEIKLRRDGKRLFINEVEYVKL